MTGGKLVQATEFTISHFLVEAGCLKAERVELDAARAALARLRFCGFHERLAETFATVLIGNPQQVHEQPAEKSFADESADDLALVAERDGQRAVIDLGHRAGNVTPQALEDFPLGRTVHPIDVQRHHRGMVQLSATLKALSGSSIPKQRL